MVKLELYPEGVFKRFGLWLECEKTTQKKQKWALGLQHKFTSYLLSSLKLKVIVDSLVLESIMHWTNMLFNSIFFIVW